MNEILILRLIILALYIMGMQVFLVLSYSSFLPSVKSGTKRPEDLPHRWIFGIVALFWPIAWIFILFSPSTIWRSHGQRN